MVIIPDKCQNCGYRIGTSCGNAEYASDNRNITSPFEKEDYPQHCPHSSAPESNANLDKDLAYKILLNKMDNLHETKKHSYGPAFYDAIDRVGMAHALGQIYHKYARAEHLIMNNIANEESPEESLIDLANYCLMTLVKMQENKLRGL